MHDILCALFLDNPYIPEQIDTFCSRLPEFQKAEQDYQTAAAKLQAQVNKAEFDAFEETLNWYLAQYANAYYLFGLALRQEVLFSLGQAG